MLPLAYTQSFDLKEHIREIDMLRLQLLGIPLTEKNEMKLLWEAKATRIYSSLSLAHHLLSRTQVLRILGSQSKHLPNEFKDVLAYKTSLEYIDGTWRANPKPVTLQTIIHIGKLAHPHARDTIERSITAVAHEIKATLDYLETQNDHPVIQAGIAQCLLSTSAAIPGDFGIIARLTASIYLAKYGYDCRGLVTVEKHWANQENSYTAALESLAKQGNLNHWLLFFVTTLKDNIQERIKDLTNVKFTQEFPASFWDITDRQKAILTYLEEPTNAITNRQVQTMFTISQITASRDLSRLLTLGMVTSKGKGRSVRYVRA